jgi:hypothetical protein
MRLMLLSHVKKRLTGAIFIPKLSQIGQPDSRLGRIYPNVKKFRIFNQKICSYCENRLNLGYIAARFVVKHRFWVEKVAYSTCDSDVSFGI